MCVMKNSTKYSLCPENKCQVTKKLDFFSEIRYLVGKTSPTIQNEESRGIIMCGCPKIQKCQRLRQTRRQKTKQQ